jgi:AmmeMemoRadiSam system protein B
MRGVIMNFEDIRYNIVAGSFYPGNADTLKKQITEFLSKAEDKKIKDIKALICPHAGYIYSGQVAAYSYRQIEGKKFDSIFIIAPSHSEHFEFNSVYCGKAYQTPLGLVQVDVERCTILTDSGMPNTKSSKYGHRSEHSLEVQLPFLQLVLDDFKIVPIVMGYQSKPNIEALGNAIGNLFKNENILIIASTDLSHYHPYNTAVSLDKKVEDSVKKFDADSFEEEFLEDSIEMCGGGPVISAMIASKILGANSSEILCYKNSGDVSGDRSAVVGYLSAAFYKK